MSNEMMIGMSTGKYFFHDSWDEETGIRYLPERIQKEEAERLIAGAKIIRCVVDDGIGTMVFYKGNPDVVHTMIFVP